MFCKKAALKQIVKFKQNIFQLSCNPSLPRPATLLEKGFCLNLAKCFQDTFLCETAFLTKRYNKTIFDSVLLSTVNF